MSAGTLRSRILRAVLIGSTLLGSWLAMQAVHELGHVLGAAVSGGRVVRVVLHPLTISRTDMAENPQPMVVAWAGPLGGILLPLGLWLLSATLRLPGTFVLRFFAGFCLIANGVYLSAGAVAGIGDAGDLLRHGAPGWCLGLFGALTVPAGLWLWHRQGRHFGLGCEPNEVRPAVAWGAGTVCVLLAVLGWLLGR